MNTAGIIGGAGFIGSHITRKFLAGGYRVRVSASDITNSAKYAHPRTACRMRSAWS